MTRRIGLGALALLGAAALSACGGAPTPASGREERVSRGKYLVDAIGCTDCHTPFKMGPKGPEKDPSRFLSGHPETFNAPPPPPITEAWIMNMAATGTSFAGPWGITYAANLTPDVNTGLGLWTEDMFLRAIKEGKHWGQSRTIMPPMPWEAFRNFSDEDLRSIYAYLRTIPPVTNHVPEYQPPAETEE